MSLQLESITSLHVESTMSFQVESTVAFQVESTMSLPAESTISLPSETTISSPEKSECGSSLNESIFWIAPYHKIAFIVLSVITYTYWMIRRFRNLCLKKFCTKSWGTHKLFFMGQIFTCVCLDCSSLVLKIHWCIFVCNVCWKRLLGKICDVNERDTMHCTTCTCRPLVLFLLLCSSFVKFVIYLDDCKQKYMYLIWESILGLKQQKRAITANHSLIMTRRVLS